MAEFAACVPLFQTLIWVLLIVGVLIWGRKHWNGLLGAFRSRVEGGDTVKFGLGSFSTEFRRETKGAVHIVGGDEAIGGEASEEPDRNHLELRRTGIGQEQRGVHLVHVAVPSTDISQRYDIFVSLSGWLRSSYGQPDDLSDVVSAEFHLGPKFAPSGSLVKNDGRQPLGFVTSAHGPVVCVCRVTFTDGYQVVLSRYLDFEAAELTERVLKESGVYSA